MTSEDEASAEGGLPFHLRHAERRTAVAAGVVGNVLEWYDFALYGYMASVLSRLFFPGDDPLVSLLATYGVFAAGFAMRPLGSVLFGWLGDVLGRSRALLLSVALMVLPTLALGVLPTHASVGALAPLLLVAIRMLQGVSVGGEFSSSVTYLVETAPSAARGLAGSWANLGSVGGMLLGSAAAALCAGLLSDAALAAWGWRIPFLAGGVLGAVALGLRKDLPESRQFQRYEELRCARTPLAEAFRCNRAEMAQGTLLAAAYGALFYLALVYLPTWASESAGVPLAVSLRANTLATLLLLPGIPLAGWASDRLVPRTPLLSASFGAMGVAGLALFPWMATGSPVALYVGQVALALILAVPLGVAPALFTELFPESDRLTGYSIVFNLGVGVVGGLTPMAATGLVLRTGAALAPTGLLAVAAAVGVGALLWMRDRSREPLRSPCTCTIHQAMRDPVHRSTRRRELAREAA